jgi:hypothetical protein
MSYVGGASGCSHQRWVVSLPVDSAGSKQIKIYSQGTLLGNRNCLVYATDPTTLSMNTSNTTLGSNTPVSASALVSVEVPADGEMFLVCSGLSAVTPMSHLQSIVWTP